MPDVPFDSQRGTIPNEQGRVKDSSTGQAHPGTYVAGWIKRGPTGFIGTNKSCSQQTVTSLVEDYNNGLLADPPQRLSGLSKVIQRRQPTIIGHDGWLAIDRAEIARGKECRTAARQVCLGARDAARGRGCPATTVVAQGDSRLRAGGPAAVAATGRPPRHRPATKPATRRVLRERLGVCIRNRSVGGLTRCRLPRTS